MPEGARQIKTQTMKTALLVIAAFMALSCTQVLTLSYPYETHFHKHIPDERHWIRHDNTVTIESARITIGDGEKTFVYSITKGPVFRSERKYRVYHVEQSKTNFMIMIPLDNSYVNVINQADSTVWMLAETNF